MLNVAVIGDIHSNHLAFKAVIEAIEKAQVDQILFLGDYLTDCAYPEKTMMYLYALRENYPCFFVRGNREEYLLQMQAGELPKRRCSSAGSVLYTYERITGKDLDFFNKMPIARQVTFQDLPPVAICHGSPFATREHMYPGTESLSKAFSVLKTDVVIAGHNHHRSYALENGKEYFNPDSVAAIPGTPGFARYGWLTGENGKWRFSFRSAAFDNKAAADEIRQSGLQDYANVYAKAVQKSLLTGENFVFDCAVLAHKLAMKAGETIIPLQLPEIYWEAAAQQLNL